MFRRWLVVLTIAMLWLSDHSHTRGFVARDPRDEREQWARACSRHPDCKRYRVVDGPTAAARGRCSVHEEPYTVLGAETSF